MIIPSLQYEQSLWKTGSRYVVGIDEVGRGAVAGPVVAAAVVFSSDHLPIPGVRDSKTLSKKQRQDLETQILASAQFAFISEATSQEIDELGIVPATILAMRRALQHCPAVDQVLIDGLPFPNNQFAEYSPTYIVKGDQLCYSIAAASIIAKEHRDRLMIEYGKQLPEFGFEKHVGYGTAMHREAITQYGLSQIHRKSFCKAFQES